jgi:hypothetical protein
MFRSGDFTSMSCNYIKWKQETVNKVRIKETNLRNCITFSVVFERKYVKHCMCSSKLVKNIWKFCLNMFFNYVDYKILFQPKQTSYNIIIFIAWLVFYDEEHLKKCPFFASLKSMKKVVGSGSGSISQRYGSGDSDPDPHKNFTDLQQLVAGDLDGG